jgi:hypothetical protein
MIISLSFLNEIVGQFECCEFTYSTGNHIPNVDAIPYGVGPMALAATHEPCLPRAIR